MAKRRYFIMKETGGGKLLRRSANQSHNLEHKSPKQKRAFNKSHAVDGDNGHLQAEATDALGQRVGVVARLGAEHGAAAHEVGRTDGALPRTAGSSALTSTCSKTSIPV